jgi:hypothetical protein
MRNPKMLVTLAIVLLAPACGPIEWLNPCYMEEDLVLDTSLVGSWKDEDGTGLLKFREAGGKSYEMVYMEERPDNAEPEETKYDARLVRQGDYLFLDMVPKVTEVNPGAYKLTIAPLTEFPTPYPPLTKLGDGLYASLVPGQPDPETGREGECCEVRLIQAHWVFQVRLDGTSLRLIDLSDDWFRESAKQGRIHVAFEDIGDTLVLPGSTEELR